MVTQETVIRSENFFLGIGAKVGNGAFTLDVKSVLNENLGGILDGTRC
jgi:hypothetical protein